MNRKEARKRAVELVAQMTLEEKASQLRYDAPAIKRLGIPAYNWWNEALHGVARSGQATVYPQAIGLAATFDTELLEQIADATATEGRAKYNAYSSVEDRDIYKGLTFWAPNVNIFRDPRWGRGHETYGEDPYLTSRMGVAYVKGLQGDGETRKAAACAKHFAVHSGPEAVRHEFNAVATAKDMEETYLPAFEALVKEADVEAVMGAYNRTNGEPCCGSTTLMKNILRDKWGFQGHFVSDCWAIRDFHEHHMVTTTAAESAAMAMHAGCDLNCGVTYLHLLNAHKQGLVSEEEITEAAVRLFTTRYMLGMFDGSEYDTISYLKVECKEHLALAEKAAEESFVLLKNNGILPLDKNKLKTVGVVGPNANSRAALIGNYHGNPSRFWTIQDGIMEYVGDDVRVLSTVGAELFKDKSESLAIEYDRLSEVKCIAKECDVLFLCLGLDETLEGEEGDTGNSYASGDKTDLNLPESQRRLMQVAAECGKPVVLLMMAGSDIDMSFATEHFDAIMQLWYPGGEGGKAVARVLFGDVSPSGKLPVTFYETLEELPEFTDYTMKGRTYRYMTNKAQYPFGFGLTYGKLEMVKAEIVSGETNKETPDQADNSISESGKIYHACVTVKNPGERTLGDVIQIYIEKSDSANDTLHPSLCAFERVTLKAGEEQTVTIPICEKAFTVVNEAGERVVEGNHFKFYIGFSQPDERSVELMGQSPLEVSVEL